MTLQPKSVHTAMLSLEALRCGPATNAIYGMIAIAFPANLNWFYARLAAALEKELLQRGLDAVAVAAHALNELRPSHDDTLLVVSAGESAESAERVGSKPAFLGAIRRFDRRVLVNYDSIHSRWFLRQLKLGEGLFTHIFDIGAAAQAERQCVGLPYTWIPETLWLSSGVPVDEVKAGGRALPWAVIGHANESRAALVSALVKSGASNGFVYLPPLKPYGAAGGLEEDTLHAVLCKTDIYIWNSHHLYPYHEGLRAIQAVLAGAAPAKIDPLHAHHFSEIPWVYPSLEALFAARDRLGVPAMHAAARAYIARFPDLGHSVAKALVGL